MLNILSFLIGLFSLIIVLPSQIPFLGWGNWFALPIVVVGIVVGMLSSNGGRNFSLIVLAIASLRLMLGGGIF